MHRGGVLAAEPRTKAITSNRALKRQWRCYTEEIGGANPADPHCRAQTGGGAPAACRESSSSSSSSKCYISPTPLSDSPQHDKVSVAIVGGGPAAHSAAIYLARAELSPLLLEGWLANGIAAGGQLTTTT